MGGAAGTRDDDLEAFVFRAIGKIIKAIRRAVGGNDAGFVFHVQRIQRIGGILHGLPVGLAAHDDGDGGVSAVTSLLRLTA